MMRIGNAIRWAIAAGLVGLSFANASWLAPEPAGAMAVVAANTGDQHGCATVSGVRQALIDGGGPVVIDADAKQPCVQMKTVLEQFPRYRFIFRTSNAESTLAAFAALKRPVDDRYSFIGDAAAMSAVRAQVPAARAWTVAEGRVCFADYAIRGWLAIVPGSCRGKAIIVPLDQKWKMAGWPNRFQKRMADAGAQVILAAPGDRPDVLSGLTQLEQIPQVPRDFTGLLWVDDVALIGPAIRR